MNSGMVASRSRVQSPVTNHQWLEQGKHTFVTFAPPDVGNAIAAATEPYDGMVIEMEHNPYDARTLRDCLQYLLNRRQIVESGTVAPAVTPLVRIPPNGGEMSRWIAKQVIDADVYGIIWSHVTTVEEARRALTATPGRPAWRHDPHRRESCPLCAWVRMGA